MATDVIMPALGMDQDQGTLLRWFKEPGDTVMAGEPLMEVETDKVVVEIDAIASGVLADVTAGEGAIIPVGQTIAHILSSDEVRNRAVPRGSAAERDELAEIDTNLPPLPSPRNAPPLVSASNRVLASPLARQLATESHVDLHAITGSGPDGAIVAADVRQATAIAQGAPATFAPPSPAQRTTPSQAVVPMSTPWQVMAERMAASWTSAPHFFLVREVVATEIVGLRQRLLPLIGKRSGVRLTYTDLLVKMLGATLPRHPRLNASWVQGAIQETGAINIGIAVATDDALLVPVLDRADTRTLGEIALERTALVERATQRKLTPADMGGGTFTLTNLGMYGVDTFNAIINPPQAAILAVGRIADRVVAVAGQPAVRATVILSLSCDHRVVDGARAARFLDDLAQLIEEPWGLLV